MASTFSTDLKLELMVTGENSGTWGDKTNTNLNLLQQAIAGYQSIALTSTNTTLAMSNATISDARNAVIKFTGTIAANTTVFVDSGIEKTYIIENGTSGAFTLALNQVGGNSVIFGATDKTSKIVYLDGTNANDLGLANLTAPQTLTNKTLTTPTLTSPIIDIIDDTNGNEEIKFIATASAVNELTVANAATGNAPEISSTGDDTNIDIKITPKGTGKVVLDGIKYPNSDGSVGQVLSTDGSGNLSFTTIESSPANLQSAFILATDKSTTIRNAVSISKINGEIGEYPVLNTFPDSTINTITTSNTSIFRSIDGTHNLLLTSGTATVVYFTGVYTPHNGTPVIGTTSVSFAVGGTGKPGPSRSQTQAYSFGSNLFLTVLGGQSDDGGDQGQSCGSNICVAQVNTSGTITKNNVIGLVTNTNANGVPRASLINNSIAVHNTGQGTFALVKISSNLTTVASSGSGGQINAWSAQNTSMQVFGYGDDGIVYYPSGNSVFFNTVNASATTFSSQVIQNINFHSNISQWYKVGNLRWLASYSNVTTAISSYTVFNVNSTTMAFTSVSTTTATYAGIVNFIASAANQVGTSVNSTVAISTLSAGVTKQVGTIGLSTNGEILGFGSRISMSPNVDITKAFSNTDTSTQAVLAFTNTSLQYRNFQINASATVPFNYVGIAAANDTTSPASVSTEGIVGGYTGLSIGQQLYANLDDGSLTTAVTSVTAGYAITSTQVLIKGVSF